MQNQKGNIVLIIVGIVAVAILAGGVGYFVAKKPAQKEDQKQEKQTNQQQIQQEQKPISEITEQKTQQPEVKDETADWKTYRNEKYGYEIKYPQNGQILTCLDDIQLFLYISKNIESCDEPRTIYDFAITGPGTPPGNINYAKILKDIYLNNIKAKRYIDVPTGQDLDHPSGIVDMVVISSNNKTFMIELSDKKELLILDQILSTFKFIK